MTLTNLIEVPRGRMDNFGSRLQTYIMPPKTCNWNFYIASDDNGLLCLSTDTNPAHKIPIASVSSWTSSRQWDKFPSEQKSAPIYLEQGSLYYLEAKYKEGGGGDNLAIAWECLDHGIPLEVIDASYTRTSVPAVAVTSSPTRPPTLPPVAGGRCDSIFFGEQTSRLCSWVLLHNWLVTDTHLSISFPLCSMDLHHVRQLI